MKKCQKYDARRMQPYKEKKEETQSNLVRRKENYDMYKKGKWKETGWKYKMKEDTQKMVSNGDTTRKESKKKEFHYLIKLERERKILFILCYCKKKRNGLEKE
jgi:hypothetical protein